MHITPKHLIPFPPGQQHIFPPVIFTSDGEATAEINSKVSIILCIFTTSDRLYYRARAPRTYYARSRKLYHLTSFTDDRKNPAWGTSIILEAKSKIFVVSEIFIFQSLPIPLNPVYSFVSPPYRLRPYFFPPLQSCLSPFKTRNPTLSHPRHISPPITQLLRLEALVGEIYLVIYKGKVSQFIELIYDYRDGWMRYSNCARHLRKLPSKGSSR